MSQTRQFLAEIEHINGNAQFYSSDFAFCKAIGELLEQMLRAQLLEEEIATDKGQ